jgi:hypothetical protein
MLAVHAVFCRQMYFCALFLLLTHVSACEPILRSSVGTTGLKPFSITQVKNARWNPKPVSTTTIYAASFLKHNKPMPELLQSAWNNLQSSKNFRPRDVGQTTSTSDGL